MRLIPVLTAGCFVVLGACSEGVLAPGGAAPVEAARADRSALLFQSAAVQEGDVLTQAQALQQAADGLVEASTYRGAALGAAIGCGVTLATGSGIEDCVTRAAVGAASGAVMGHVAGDRDVQRRVALVSAEAVGRDLQSAANQFAQIETDLPRYLAAQETQMNRLMMQQMRGEISAEAYEAAVLRVEGDRLALADALEMSARDVRKAARNLQSAMDDGQMGLEAAVETSTRLASDIDAARASFAAF